MKKNIIIKKITYENNYTYINLKHFYTYINLWDFFFFYHPETKLSIISFNILIKSIIIPILQIKKLRTKEVTWFSKVSAEYNSEIVKQND